VADVFAEFIARLRARLGSDGAVRVIGEVELEMRRSWGGQWIYVSESGDLGARNARIVEARLKGKSVGEIAREFGLKPRQVRNILRKIA
jgi:Mor family transcriptional regulator